MSMTTLDLRGRDLIITPPENQLSLPTPELLDALFGNHLPKMVRNGMGRDKRYHFLRTQPIYFTEVKRALRQQQTALVVVHMSMAARSKLERWRKRRRQTSCITRDARERERFPNAHEPNVAAACSSSARHELSHLFASPLLSAAPRE